MLSKSQKKITKQNSKPLDENLGVMLASMHPNVFHDWNIFAKFLGDDQGDEVENDALSTEQLNDKTIDDDSTLTVVKLKSHKYNIK